MGFPAVAVAAYWFTVEIGLKMSFCGRRKKGTRIRISLIPTL
jgi:hypothetical protein